MKRTLAVKAESEADKCLPIWANRIVGVHLSPFLFNKSFSSVSLMTSFFPVYSSSFPLWSISMDIR